MNVSLRQIIIVSPFFDQSGGFVSKKLSKMPFLQLFTAFYGMKRYWMMTSWPVFMHECVLVLENHCLLILWSKRLFRTKKLSKMPFLRLFKALYGTKWYWIMTSCPVFMHECILVPDNHRMPIFWSKWRFCTQKTVKNAIFTAFYGILRHKMILNNDQLPCIYAWMCLSARLSLFDHFLTTAAVLDQKNSQKCQFYGFWRHFRAF